MASKTTLGGKQLTLFQCCNSDSALSDSNSDILETADSAAGAKRVRLSSGSDEELSSEPLARECSEPALTSNASCFPRNQTNNITLTNPMGPTTLVVNNLPAATRSAVNFVNPPCNIASTPACSPVQPTGITFPATLISGESRFFNPSWCTTYPWLEYSTERDACYSYSCRLFGCGTGSKCEKTFTIVGFRDWKHATGKSGVLYKHDISFAHRQSVAAWNQYKSNTQHQHSIAEQLGMAREEQIRKNQHYIKTLAEIVLLCSHQEIQCPALRQ